MSETTQLAILPAVSSSDPHAAGAIKGAKNGVNGQSTGNQEHNAGSFLDFLNAFNALSTEKNATPETTAQGGNILPLAIETADTGHMPLSAAIPVTPQGADLTTQMQHVEENTLESFTLSSPLAGATEEDLSSRVTSSALASRLVNLAKSSPATGENPVITPAVSSATTIATSTPVQNSSAGEALLPDSALQISNRLQHAAAVAPANNELANKTDTALVTKQGSVSNSTEFLASSTHTTDIELSETDTLFATQVKRMIAEQQGGLLPEKQLAQHTLASTTANTGSFDPVSAAQLRPASTQPMLTPETISTTGFQATLPETFGRPEWNQGMGKQILWMANQNIRTAELRLNPAHLGPIEVRIEMDDDQVSLAFSSRHAVVREAVEQAMPRLREMFEESGLNLADTDVSQQSFAEQRSQEAASYPGQTDSSVSGHLADDTGEDPANTEKPNSLNMGLVDYYI